MNLKFFTAAVLATGATAGRQGAELQTFNQAAEQYQALYADDSFQADESMSPRQRRKWVRIILWSCLVWFQVIPGILEKN